MDLMKILTSDSTIIGIIVIAIFVFFLIRELVCWYYKINKQIKIQQAILETMLKILEKNGGDVNWDAAKEILGKQ